MISFKDLCRSREINLLFLFSLLIIIENKVVAQCPAPAQPFFSYNGGDITFNTSDSIGKCYKNLQAGQTYCFYFVQPLDTIIQIDMNMSGCNTCLNSMYTDVKAYSAYVQVQGNVSGFAGLDRCVTFNPFQDSIRCNFRTYNSSCNLLTKGVIAGNCLGLDAGKVFTYCFTVPPTCGGMSFCPLYKCGTCPTLKVDSGTICAGDCFRISATLAGGKPPYTYSWTPNIGNGPGPYFVCPSTTTTYRLQVTDSAGLVFSDSGRVTVRPKPNLVLSPDTSICRGASVNLNASGGTKYLWSDSSSLSCGSCSNPVASPVNSTQYTIIASIGFCKDTGSLTVNISPAPNVSAGPDIQICRGTTDTLKACCGITYSWSPVTGLSNPGVSNPVISPIVNSNYVVTVTDINGCSASDTVLVSVYPDFTADAGPDIRICYNSTDTLNACCGSSYLWSPSFGLSDTTVASPLVTLKNSSSYFVTITDSNGCKKSDTVAVSVFPLFTASAGPDLQLCVGATDTLSGCCGVSYLWNPGTGLSNDTISNPIVLGIASTFYVLRVKDANGCAALDTVDINLYPAAIVNVGTDTTVCIGDTARLNVCCGVSYLWSPATGLSDTSTAAPSANVFTNTDYIVKVIDSNGCVAIDTMAIKVYPAFIANAGPDIRICIGESDTLNACCGASCVWYPSADLSNPAIRNPILNTTVNGTYTVTITDNNGCQKSDSLNVTVYPAFNVTSGPDLKICAGNGDTISVCCGQSYLWSPAAGLSNPNINNPIANPSATTTYTVTVTDANGCSASADVNVSVLSLPVASINPLNATICIGDNVLLTASGGGAYLWSTGATNSSISVAPVSNAGFSVTVTDANLCSASANASVLVDQPPIANAGADVTITRGGSVILSASGGTQYQWIPAVDLSCEFCNNPAASPNNDREYCVIVSNTNNCSDTDCVLVTVIPDINVFIPNVFTPNQDGNNDYFQLYGNLQYINQCEVTVWNRWGEKVFASNDLLFKWDGIYIGKKVPPGVYAYQISLNLANETTAKKYKGSVTVLE